MSSAYRFRGTVSQVTDQSVFFGPILLATIAAPKSPDGIPPPQSGTVAFKGVFVVLQLYNEYVSQWVIMTRKMTQTASDGTFEFTVNASEMGTRGFLTIWPARPDPQFPGAVSPLYRSNAFQVAPFADPVDESGDPRLLNVALFVDTLPNADGVTAGAGELFHALCEIRRGATLGE